MCHDFAGNELIFQYLALNVQISHQSSPVEKDHYFENIFSRLFENTKNKFDDYFVLYLDRIIFTTRRR